MMMASRISWGAQLAVVLSIGLVAGCSDDGRGDETGGGISNSGPTLGTGVPETTGETDSDDTLTTDDTNDSMPKLDQASDDSDSGDSGLPCGEGDLCECEIPPHTPCDAAANVPLSQAMGLNCPGENPQVTFTTNGAAAGMGTRTNFGALNAFPAQEGSQFVVIGSGPVADLDLANDLLACSQDLGAFDPGTLPPPMIGTDVGGDCFANPALLGTGDCSNTIEAQLSGTVNDYTELRITATAPETVNSFSYNLAYFSYEYPDYYLSVFNDMYIGWLESEVWTGNISFDENGAPISLNAGFLDYRDAVALNDPMCANGCSAPELGNTCMQGHAGTKWLTTNAGIKPGETFTLALAIFDMSDSILDSYAFIDNFQWGCEGEVPPSTTPIE